MTDKCKAKGAHIIEQCEESQKALYLGFINSSIAQHSNNQSQRMAFVIFNQKQTQCTPAFNFCPWCGGNIATKYTERATP